VAGAVFEKIQVKIQAKIQALGALTDRPSVSKPQTSHTSIHYSNVTQASDSGSMARILGSPTVTFLPLLLLSPFSPPGTLSDVA